MNKDALRQLVPHGTQSFPFAAYEHDRSKDTMVEIHWHDETEFIFLGEGQFSVNINFQERKINGPAFVLINAGEIHSLLLPRNQREDAVVFDLGMLSFEGFDMVQYKLLTPLTDGRLKLPNFILKDTPAFSGIQSAYERIFMLKGQNSVSSFLRIKTCLYEILSVLYEKNLIESVADDRKIDHIKRVLTFMHENSSRRITVEEAASFAGMNPQYFCRYFKKLTGKTMTEYLNQLRVEKAAFLLSSTDYLISDIAMQCGFDNLGYFIKRFESSKHMTPSSFRKCQNSVKNGQYKGSF